MMMSRKQGVKSRSGWPLCENQAKSARAPLRLDRPKWERYEMAESHTPYAQKGESGVQPATAAPRKSSFGPSGLKNQHKL